MREIDSRGYIGVAVDLLTQSSMRGRVQCGMGLCWPDWAHASGGDYLHNQCDHSASLGNVGMDYSCLR